MWGCEGESGAADRGCMRGGCQLLCWVRVCVVREGRGFVTGWCGDCGSVVSLSALCEPLCCVVSGPPLSGTQPAPFVPCVALSFRVLRTRLLTRGPLCAPAAWRHSAHLGCVQWRCGDDANAAGGGRREEPPAKGESAGGREREWSRKAVYNRFVVCVSFPQNQILNSHHSV